MSLRKVARELAHRAARAGQRGRVAGAAELRDLARAFAGRYPAWLADLLAEVPLCGLRLGWAGRPPRSADDVRWAVWSHPREAQAQSLRTDWPGLLVLPLGYVNVALDGNHCGDPYFVLAGGARTRPCARSSTTGARRAKSWWPGGGWSPLHSVRSSARPWCGCRRGWKPTMPTPDPARGPGRLDTSFDPVAVPGDAR